jgi:hypothetical protein
LGPKQYYRKKSNTKAYEQQWRPHPAQPKLKIKTIETDKLKAVVNLQIYQFKTRGWRDLKVKLRDLNVGDLVLLRSPCTESIGKLESKWARSYVVVQKLRPGVYHLSDPQGKMLKHSWNTDSLHHFFFKPICKSEGFVMYKRTFIVESSIAHLLFKISTLFIIWVAHKGVRFLTRQSLCTLKQQ